jgi:hypothetical protein
LSFIEAGAFLFERNERKRESRNVIAVLEKATQIVQARYFGGQNKWLCLAIECEVLACARTVIMGLSQPLDLDFTDGFAHPFRGARLSCAKEDFGGRLREHGFGILAIPGFHLAASLEAQNYRVLRFAVLCDGCVKLWQSLQAGQLVNHEPHGFLVGHRLVQEAQYERVNP